MNKLNLLMKLVIPTFVHRFTRTKHSKNWRSYSCLTLALVSQPLYATTVNLAYDTPLSYEDARLLLRDRSETVEITDSGKGAIEAARESVLYAGSKGPVYGFNRALGANINESVPVTFFGESSLLDTLGQRTSTYFNFNIMSSSDMSSDPDIYNCPEDTGVSVDQYWQARAVTLVLLNRLVKGGLGTNIELADKMVRMITDNVVPIVPRPEFAESLGSGDIVPMAAWLRTAYDNNSQNIVLPKLQDNDQIGFPIDQTGCFIWSTSSSSIKTVSKLSQNGRFDPSALDGIDAASIMMSNAYSIGTLLWLYAKYDNNNIFERLKPYSPGRRAFDFSILRLKDMIMRYVNSSGGGAFVVPELDSVDVNGQPASALTASFDDTTALVSALEDTIFYLSEATMRSNSVPEDIAVVRRLSQPVNRPKIIDTHSGDHNPYTGNLISRFKQIYDVLQGTYQFKSLTAEKLHNLYAYSEAMVGIEVDISEAMEESPLLFECEDSQRNVNPRYCETASFKRMIEFDTNSDTMQFQRTQSLTRHLAILGGYSFRAIRQYEQQIFDGPKYLAINPRNYGVGQYARVAAYHLDELRSLANSTDIAIFPTGYPDFPTITDDALARAEEHYVVLIAIEMIMAAQLAEVGAKHSAFNLTGNLLDLLTPGTQGEFPFTNFFETLRETVPFQEWDAGALEGTNTSRMGYNLSELVSKIGTSALSDPPYNYSSIEVLDLGTELDSFNDSIESLSTSLNENVSEADILNLFNLIKDRMPTDDYRVEYTNRLNDLKPYMLLKTGDGNNSSMNKLLSMRHTNPTPLDLPFKFLEVQRYVDIEDVETDQANSALSAFQDITNQNVLVFSNEPGDKTFQDAYDILLDLSDQLLAVKNNLPSIVGLSLNAKNGNSWAYDNEVRFVEPTASDHKYGWQPVTKWMESVAGAIQSATSAGGPPPYTGIYTDPDHQTLSVVNPQNRGFLDNRSFRDVVAVLAELEQLYDEIDDAIINAKSVAVPYHIGSMIARLTSQSWNRTQNLLYANDLDRVGLNFELNNLFSGGSGQNTNDVMAALYQSSVYQAQSISQVQSTFSENTGHPRESTNVYYVTQIISEAVYHLQKMVGLEAMIAKNMMNIRREYFPIYGNISMGTSGTNDLYNDVKNHCKLDKIKYIEIEACREKVFP